MNDKWEQLRTANRLARQRDSSGIETCDHCQAMYDCGDIHYVDGESLCNGCKDKME